ncbi:MAG: Toluene efflux pump periplasmic linker protein TtgG precursor [Pseudomonadota bacterium]
MNHFKPIASTFLGLAAMLASAALYAQTGTLVTVSPQPLVKPVDLSIDAVIEAVRQTTLSSQVPGAIVSLSVRVGDRVRTGQELLRIDARAAQQNVASTAAQLEAAQAALKVAARELERQKQLFAQKYISQGALDRALAQWEAAEAQVQALQAQTQAARTQTDFFVIAAPYDAVINEVPVTLGDMAMPGRPLVSLYDPTALRVTASVPQTLINRASGAAGTLAYEIPGVAGLTSPQQPVSVQVLPTIDPATRTALVRLGLPEGTAGVAPGMFARVWLPAVQQPNGPAPAARLTLPASAVIRRAELTAVYVIDAEGEPRLRQVRLGRAVGDRLEILSGISADDRVAADPQAAARRR